MTTHARMTEEQYLAFDIANEGKHEFVNGEAVAMAGASEAHSILQANILVALTNRLRGGRCRVHGSDLRVRLAETGMYAYPDVTVVCGKAEFAPTRPESLLNPRVIVEVLSETTANYDLGAKGRTLSAPGIRGGHRVRGFAAAARGAAVPQRRRNVDPGGAGSRSGEHHAVGRPASR
ncbi:MAG: Uma2 family endonuclease [Deltaproteobacteria bacterium]|nr:Uma2 family endonuclease [Deltaproteobacteria bacterium]